MPINLKNIKNFKKGMDSLTPIQLSHGRLAGLYGMVVGLVLATYQTFKMGSWGLGIFLFFLTWFQSIGIVTEHKTLKSLKEIESSIKNQPSLEDFNKELDKAEKEMK